MDKLKAWQNQIVALAALGILAAAFVVAPEERLDKLGHALVAFGSTTAGQTVYAALTALVVAAFRWALARIPSADTRPQRIPPGSGALLLALALGAATQGCGASALSTQARAATIVGVGLGSVGAELHDARATALDACHDTDCEGTTTSAWAPAVAAYESARAALTTWIDALDVARQAGEPDGDILGALFVAVSRLAREWNALAAALRGVGVDMPDLPPALAMLLGAGAAS